MLSDAVGLERISRIIGYKLKKGNFAVQNNNLPQRIVILGEANNANQGDLVTDATQITSAQDAGDKYGYGSPIHIQARILFPKQGDGVGGIPVFVAAQEEAGSATARILTITPSGTALRSGTHRLVIAGRDGMDGDFYDLNIVEGDTTGDITAKISDAISAVLGCPVTSVDTDYLATLTTKWKGLTAQGVGVTVDTGEDDLGLTYSVVQTQAGSGTPSVSDALDALGTAWTTIIVNSYGTHSGTMDLLESTNGIPDPENPTGRYRGIIMKPFIAITGSVSDDPTAITDARDEDVTIAIAPAPLSPGLAMEAAANMTVLYAVNSQNTPHLDVCGKSYPDMPVPSDGNIGSMATYENRDAFLKKGCSTVDFIVGKYQVQDFVTTYHPAGENPPQFRYCRNLMVDFNVRYGYYLLEQINVVDHTIANDTDTVSATKVLKPKQWIQILNAYADDLANRALIVDAPFMQSSIEVGLSATNPDRLETSFKYKRSGVVRIASTTAEAGFNFGAN